MYNVFWLTKVFEYFLKQNNFFNIGPNINSFEKLGRLLYLLFRWLMRKQSFEKVAIGRNREENSKIDHFLLPFLYLQDCSEHLKNTFCRYMLVIHVRNFCREPSTLQDKVRDPPKVNRIYVTLNCRSWIRPCIFFKREYVQHTAFQTLRRPSSAPFYCSEVSSPKINKFVSTIS